jgi:hypothetical protein
MSPSPFCVNIALAPPGSGSTAVALVVIPCSCLFAARIANGASSPAFSVGLDAPATLVPSLTGCPAGASLSPSGVVDVPVGGYFGSGS